MARVWDRTLSGQPNISRPLTGGTCLAKPGESVSGDAWLSESSGGRTLCAVVNGLGHGPFAAQASALAIQSLHQHRGLPLTEPTHCVCSALRPTRGAALGMAEMLYDQSLIKFFGIGNFMAAVHQNGTCRTIVSQR